MGEPPLGPILSACPPSMLLLQQDWLGRRGLRPAYLVA